MVSPYAYVPPDNPVGKEEACFQLTALEKPIHKPFCNLRDIVRIP